MKFIHYLYSLSEEIVSLFRKIMYILNEIRGNSHFSLDSQTSHIS
jgi:hypothetical protein